MPNRMLRIRLYNAGLDISYNVMVPDDIIVGNPDEMSSSDMSSLTRTIVKKGIQPIPGTMHVKISEKTFPTILSEFVDGAVYVWYANLNNSKILIHRYPHPGITEDFSTEDILLKSIEELEHPGEDIAVFTISTKYPFVETAITEISKFLCGRTKADFGDNEYLTPHLSTPFNFNIGVCVRSAIKVKEYIKDMIEDDSPARIPIPNEQANVHDYLLRRGRYVWEQSESTMENLVSIDPTGRCFKMTKQPNGQYMLGEYVEKIGF